MPPLLFSRCAIFRRVISHYADALFAIFHAADIFFRRRHDATPVTTIRHAAADTPLLRYFHFAMPLLDGYFSRRCLICASTAVIRH